MAAPVIAQTPLDTPASRVALALTALAVIAGGSVPFVFDLATTLDWTLIFILGILALSMSFLWGYVGIISFGQTAFFGLGGYTFAVISLNGIDPFFALLAAILVPLLFSLIFGYFMIYGRISDIYLSVMTLVLTVVLDKAIRATAGITIGNVGLNGQNGIPGVPWLSIPGQPSASFGIEGNFYLAGLLLVATYWGLRSVLASDFGRVLVGIRENERRVELLGYDSRRYKLAVFALCGGLAGLSGGLFATWGNFVSPEMFHLRQAAEIIIWVIVGGKNTLLGPVIGVGLVQTLTKWLGTQSVGQVNLILGIVLIFSVLAFKEGILPALKTAVLRLLSVHRRGEGKGPEEVADGRGV